MLFVFAKNATKGTNLLRVFRLPFLFFYWHLDLIVNKILIFQKINNKVIPIEKKKVFFLIYASNRRQHQCWCQWSTLHFTHANSQSENVINKMWIETWNKRKVHFDTEFMQKTFWSRNITFLLAIIVNYRGSSLHPMACQRCLILLAF